MSNNALAQASNVNYITILQSTLSQSCIVDYGFVQEVKGDGVVDVALSVSSTPQDLVVLTCVLANIASEYLTIDIKPKVGDRVIVFYPRRYDDDMFDVPESEEDRTKIIVNEEVKGYNLFSGVAFLFNQYRDGEHHNYLQIDDKDFKFNFIYDKDEDKNLFTMSIDKDAAIEIQSNDNKISLDKDGALKAELAVEEETAKFTCEVNKDGEVSIASNEDKFTCNIDKDGNTTVVSAENEIITDDSGIKITDCNDNKIEMTSSGMKITDTNGCTYESTSSAVTINGKLKVNK